MRPGWFELFARWPHWLASIGLKHGLRQLLEAVAKHTGLPVIVVAAIALVVSWRVAKRAWHLVIELALALALLLAATKLGWIRW